MIKNNLTRRGRKTKCALIFRERMPEVMRVSPRVVLFCFVDEAFAREVRVRVRISTQLSHFIISTLDRSFQPLMSRNIFFRRHSHSHSSYNHSTTRAKGRAAQLARRWEPVTLTSSRRHQPPGRQSVRIRCY